MATIATEVSQVMATSGLYEEDNRKEYTIKPLTYLNLAKAGVVMAPVFFIQHSAGMLRSFGEMLTVTSLVNVKVSARLS